MAWGGGSALDRLVAFASVAGYNVAAAAAVAVGAASFVAVDAAVEID